MSDDMWEYHCERFGGLFFPSVDIERSVEERMNKLGRQGWELVTVRRSWLTQKYRLVFERPLQPGDADQRENRDR